MGATTAHWYFQGAVYAFDGKISDEKFVVHLTEAPAVAAAKLWQDMVFKDKSAVPSTSHDVSIEVAFIRFHGSWAIDGAAYFKFCRPLVPTGFERVRRGSVLASPVPTSATMASGDHGSIYQVPQSISCEQQIYCQQTLKQIPICKVNTETNGRLQSKLKYVNPN